MARQRLHESRAASPSPADDFKRLHGIGPLIQRRLYSAGIRTFAHLAALSPDEIAALIPGLSAKRVDKQGWIRQARKLVPKKAKPKTRKKETAIPTVRQHYANFTIEFLLDEKNEARRTRAVHIQSGDADTWSGWEAEHLIDFLTRHTEMHFPPTKSTIEEIIESRSRASPATTVESIPSVIEMPRPLRPPSTEAKVVQPVTEIAQRVLSPAVADLAGTLRLRDLKVVPVNTDTPVYVLHKGQPYHLRLTLDLTKVVVPNDVPLVCRATIFAKQPGGPRQLVGEERDTFEQSENITLSLSGINLPPGTYRLEALVTLAPTGMELGRQPGLLAFLESGLLQVY